MTIVADGSKMTINEWCDRLKSLVEKDGAPIESLDDPRATPFKEQYGGPRNGFERDISGLMYLERCVPLPKFPIDMPAWATEVEYELSFWPIITVSAITRANLRDVTVEVEKSWTIDSRTGVVEHLSGKLNTSVFMDGQQPADFYEIDLSVMHRIAGVLLLAASTVEEGAVK